MKKIYAGVIALVLGLGGAVAVAESASAHNHTDSIDCSNAVVALTDYDGPATVKVTLDGVVVHDTAPFGGTFHYSQALTFDAAHQSHTMVVEVLSGDQGYSFTHTDVSPAECYTPPVVIPKDATASITTTPATCDAAGTASWVDVAYATTAALDETPGDHSGTASAVDGHHFADDSSALTVPYSIQAQLSGLTCAPPLPDTKVVYSDWTDESYVCGDTTQKQTRTVETTTYSYDDAYKVVSSTQSTTETRTVDLTDAQIAALNCPVVTPPTPPTTPVVDTQLPNVLAHTGLDESTWLLTGGIGTLIVLMGIISLASVTLYRRRHTTE